MKKEEVLKIIREVPEIPYLPIEIEVAIANAVRVGDYGVIEEILKDFIRATKNGIMNKIEKYWIE